MKKRKVFGALLCSLCLIAANVSPAMADAVKVVTLGADLTNAQKNTMLKYFKVNTNQVQILEITNADEVAHLSSYVPLEQIGTRTVSCAYVKPTQSGGIKVRTANLNWVTCNMIASTLSTSGVKNCEVVAACPFEVSGTGALTGIIMAYETASGQKLDQTKKELATEEIVVTGTLAEDVGQNEATIIMNEAKMQVLQNQIQNADDIYYVVSNIAEQNNMMLGEEQLDKIVSLLTEIAQQDYVYEDMRETLENVEENVTGEVEDVEEVDDTGSIDDTGDAENTEEIQDIEGMEDMDDEESIIEDLDESILGEDVIAGSTEDPSVGQQTSTEEEFLGDSENEETEWDYEEEVVEIPEAVPEELPEESTDLPVETPGESIENTDEESVEQTSESSFDLSVFDEETKELFEQAETFCAGAFKGDAEALQTAMGQDAVVSEVLDTETGNQLYEKVLSVYYDILLYGADSYVWAETDIYATTELNMLDQEFIKLFGIVYDETMTEDILADLSEESKALLYSDTMRFFETLYGEELPESETMEEDIEGMYEEELYEDPYMEESYNEDAYIEEPNTEETMYIEEDLYTEDGMLMEDMDVEDPYTMDMSMEETWVE